MRRWLLTLCATAVSTYLLDGVATAVGLALAASSLLAGLSGPALMALLAATYVLWGLGLRASVAANWRLLQETATSTSALSKAAHDLVAGRTASRRAARLASCAGYVGLEAIKEVPYYAGAFGVALTDAASSTDAVIFLAGTNVGAALYEYGLSRLTRTFLRVRATRAPLIDLEAAPVPVADADAVV